MGHSPLLGRPVLSFRPSDSVKGEGQLALIENKASIRRTGDLSVGCMVGYPSDNPTDELVKLVGSLPALIMQSGYSYLLPL